MPRVSIVLLSWNQATYIEECIESIAAQSFTDYEVIAVDNGSSDGSADLISDTARRLDVPLMLVRNATNEGIPHAINKALDHASGEFIVPFAADDVMLPHRLEDQVRYMDECDESYAVVSGDVALIDSRSEPLLHSPAVWLDPTGETVLTDSNGNVVREWGRVYGAMRTPWLADEDRQLESVIAGNSPLTVSAMFRSSVYATLGLYDESIAIEDYDYWLRIAQRFKIRYRPGVVVLYRRHNSNATNRDSLIWDSVHESLSRLNPHALNRAERTALEASLRKARFRCALAGMAEGLPDSRQRLMRVVRDPTEHKARRIRAAVSVVNPRLAQRLIGNAGRFG